MKSKIVLFVLLAMVTSQVSFAATKPVEKLKRGGVGIITAPFEFCNEYKNTRKEYGVPQSIADSIFVGTLFGFKRVLNGAYDIVTFPVNYPSGYGLLLPDAYETALDEHNALMNNNSGVK